MCALSKVTAVAADTRTRDRHKRGGIEAPRPRHTLDVADVVGPETTDEPRLTTIEATRCEGLPGFAEASPELLLTSSWCWAPAALRPG